MFVWLEDARERGSYEWALQLIGWRWSSWWNTGGLGEEIDEFKNKKFGERATKVRDAVRKSQFRVYK